MDVTRVWMDDTRDQTDDTTSDDVVLPGGAGLGEAADVEFGDVDRGFVAEIEVADQLPEVAVATEVDLDPERAVFGQPAQAQLDVDAVGERRSDADHDDVGGGFRRGCSGHTRHSRT